MKREWGRRGKDARETGMHAREWHMGEFDDEWESHRREKRRRMRENCDKPWRHAHEQDCRRTPRAALVWHMRGRQRKKERMAHGMIDNHAWEKMIHVREKDVCECMTSVTECDRECKSWKREKRRSTRANDTWEPHTKKRKWHLGENRAWDSDSMIRTHVRDTHTCQRMIRIRQTHTCERMIRIGEYDTLLRVTKIANQRCVRLFRTHWLWWCACIVRSTNQQCVRCLFCTH